MGIVLKVFGILAIIVGIILTITIIGAAAGIPTIINGIVLFAIGAIYEDVKTIKEGLRR